MASHLSKSPRVSRKPINYERKQNFLINWPLFPSRGGHRLSPVNFLLFYIFVFFNTLSPTAKRFYLKNIKDFREEDSGF